jgi:hypothetical protein
MSWQDDIEHYQERYWNPLREYSEQFQALCERKAVTIKPNPELPATVVHCKSCGVEVDAAKSNDPYCQVCACMIDTLISSSYWQCVQKEWNEDQKRKRTLIRGGD